MLVTGKNLALVEPEVGHRRGQRHQLQRFALTEEPDEHEHREACKQAQVETLVSHQFAETRLEVFFVFEIEEIGVERLYGPGRSRSLLDLRTRAGSGQGQAKKQ